MTTLGSLYGHSRRTVSHAASQHSASRPASSHAEAGPSSSTQPVQATTPKMKEKERPLLRHNVLMAGLRRSGKSLIIKVVHEHLSPSDTLFLESNSTGAKGRWTTQDVDGFIALRVWDGPGNTPSIPISRGRDGEAGPSSELDTTAAEVKEGKLQWKDVGAVIFVIDAQDDYFDAISRLHELILTAFAINPLVHFHIFVHKVDGLSDDYKFDIQHDIEQRLLDELADASASFAFAPGAAEELAKAQAQEGLSDQVNGSTTLSGTASPFSGLGGKSPIRPSSGSFLPLETTVRLHFHLSSIYDNSVFVSISKVQQSLMQADIIHSLESACDSISGSCNFDKAFLIDVADRVFVSTDSSPFDPASFDMACEYLNFLLNFSNVYKDLRPPDTASAGAATGLTSSVSLASSQSSLRTGFADRSLGGKTNASNEGQAKEGKYASSVLKLSPDITICFWQLDGRLSLIALLKSDVQARNAGLIDYNVTFFRRAIVQIAQIVRAGQLADSNEN